MKNFSKLLLVISLGFGLIGSTMAATAPTLGIAAGYAVYSDAGITNTVWTTHIRWNVGDNGFGHPGLIAWQVDGTLGITAGAWVAAAVLIAYGQLAAQPGAVPLVLAGNNAVGPGVYDIGAGTLNGTLTLSGAGVYVFRSTSSITVTPGVGAKVLLTNGADACNVFWQIPTSMTIWAGA